MNPTQPDSQRKSRLQKVLETAGAVAELAALAVLARGRLRRLDLFALGLKSVHMGLAIHQTWKADRSPELHEFFGHSECLYKQGIPFQLTRLIFMGDRVADRRTASGWARTFEGKVTEAVYEGTITGLPVAWIEHRVLGPQYAACQSANDLKRLADVAREQLWALAGSSHIRVISDGIDRGNPMPEELPEQLFDNALIQRVMERAAPFWERGGRCLLLEGEPGSGKSTAALIVAQRLGGRSVTIDAGAFLGESRMLTRSPNDTRVAEVDYASWMILRALKPDVLVLNDLDYVPEAHQAVLLADIEHAKKSVRLLFITANDKSKLIPAVRRPGRVDDVIEVPGLELGEIEQILPEMQDALRQKMRGWPLAHVLEIRTRGQVLGSQNLAREIEDVGRRLAKERKWMNGKEMG